MANHSKINTAINSLILLLVTGIAWFTQQEIQENRKSRAVVNDVLVSVGKLETKVSDFEKQLSEFVTRSQLESELTKQRSEMNVEIQELKKAVESLNRRTAARAHQDAVKP